jgi:hypothetical protein
MDKLKVFKYYRKKYMFRKIALSNLGKQNLLIGKKLKKRGHKMRNILKYKLALTILLIRKNPYISQ